jgi:SNW domain-containing protein 1
MSDWKISPNVSDWKNSGGYCIPLDKRVAADGRRMQDVRVSDGFASLSKALYVVEQKVRVAIQMCGKSGQGARDEGGHAAGTTTV